MNMGADLSKRTIYIACVDIDKVIGTAQIEMFENPRLGYTLLKRCLDAYKAQHGAQSIYIEQPYANPRSPRPMSFLDLGRACAFVEIAAYEAEVEPIFVGNSEWRFKVYGKGRPADPKTLARKFVAEAFGFQTKYKYEHNIAESILLAHYGNLIDDQSSR